MMGMETTTLTCTKCDGAGSIRGFEHVMNGVCFACEGKGVVAWNDREVRRSARVPRNQERNAILVADHPELADAFWNAMRTDGTLFTEAKKALHGAATTDAGIDALRKVLRP